MIAILLEDFPGVLLPRTLRLVRTPQGIESQLVFVWVSWRDPV